MESRGIANEAANDIPPSPAPPVTAPITFVRARNPNWLWYSALFVAVVATLGGLGLLYEDDTTWQRNSNQLAQRNATLHQQLLTSQTSLSDTQQQVKTLKAQALHPKLGIWNVKQNINGPNWYLAGGVPDTFTYHLGATSTGAMSVSIITFEGFAKAIECVDKGTGDTNWCMHHAGPPSPAKSWLNVTSVDYDFHLAEGCANYMVVFTAASAITVTPNVTVTYNPAPTFTGDC